jgi:DNA polymerase III alpha subunit
MSDSTVDLHLHTTCSHGRFSPTRVVELAAKRGLSAIAITDHNTAASLVEVSRSARARARPRGMSTTHPHTATRYLLRALRLISAIAALAELTWLSRRAALA